MPSCLAPACPECSREGLPNFAPLALNAFCGGSALREGSASAKRAREKSVVAKGLPRASILQDKGGPARLPKSTVRRKCNSTDPSPPKSKTEHPGAHPQDATRYNVLAQYSISFLFFPGETFLQPGHTDRRMIHCAENGGSEADGGGAQRPVTCSERDHPRRTPSPVCPHR